MTELKDCWGIDGQIFYHYSYGYYLTKSLRTIRSPRFPQGTDTDSPETAQDNSGAEKVVICKGKH